MASPVKIEAFDSASTLDPSNCDFFYVTTVIGGEVQKVINARCGSLVKVRKVQDFAREVDFKNETALALTRNQLRSMIVSEARVSKRERTLAEFVLDLKRRKSVEGLETVQCGPPPKAEVCPPVDVISVDHVKVESLSRNPKRRRITSEWHSCTRVQDAPSEPLDSQLDDETLSNYLKRCVSTKGRASSGNTDMEVFQRRKKNLKAVRRRIAEAGTGASQNGSGSRDNQSSTTVRVCKDMCERRECQLIDSEVPEIVSSHSAVGNRMARLSVSVDGMDDKSALRSESGALLSPSSVLDHQSESSDFVHSLDLTLEKSSVEGTEKYLHPDPCIEEIVTPAAGYHSSNLIILLDDQSSQVAADNGSDDTQVRMEQFHHEDVNHFLSDDEATLQSRNPGNSLAGRDLKNLDPAKLCVPIVQMLNSETTQLTPSGTCDEESSACLGSISSCRETLDSLGTMSLRQGPVDENRGIAEESIVSLVSPTELELAEERIDALLDTLVVSDDLLPNHLSASVNCGLNSSKRKRTSLAEPVILSSPNSMGGSHLGTMAIPSLRPSLSLRGDKDSPSSTDALWCSTDNVSSSVNLAEEATLSRTTLSSGMSIEDLNISEARRLSHGLTLVGNPGEIDTPRVMGDLRLNNEEQTCSENLNLIPTGDAEISGSSPNSLCYNEDSRESVEGDAKHELADVSTFEADLYSNLTDGFTKRNRKTFSPKSQFKLLKASRPESARKPSFKFKIKQMKSNAQTAGPNASTETTKPSERLKSILKTGGEPLNCRGMCKCPKCISTRDRSIVAREFISSQMKLAENIITRLIQEMRGMRTLVEDSQQTLGMRGISDSCEPASEKIKGVLECAAKLEDWAIAQILKLGRDSKRVCRLIETGPRRTIFADEAGSDLEYVRLLPMKKTLTLPLCIQ